MEGYFVLTVVNYNYKRVVQMFLLGLAQGRKEDGRRRRLRKNTLKEKLCLVFLCQGRPVKTG